MNTLFKSKHLFTIFILLISLAFSCRKEAQFDLSPEIKSLWDFKPGTYWIYQDSISGEIDSVYVTDYQNRYDTYRGSRNLTNKEAKFQLIGYQFTLFGNIITNGIFIDPFELNEVLFQNELRLNMEEPWLFYEKKQNEEIPNNEFCKDISIITQAPLFYNSSSYDNSPIKKYCAMPNIGIVRYEFKDGNVYKLIRQYIIQ